MPIHFISFLNLTIQTSKVECSRLLFKYVMKISSFRSWCLFSWWSKIKIFQEKKAWFQRLLSVITIYSKYFCCNVVDIHDKLCLFNWDFFLFQAIGTLENKNPSVQNQLFFISCHFSLHCTTNLWNPHFSLVIKQKFFLI